MKNCISILVIVFFVTSCYKEEVTQSDGFLIGELNEMSNAQYGAMEFVLSELEKSGEKGENPMIKTEKVLLNYISDLDLDDDVKSGAIAHTSDILNNRIDWEKHQAEISKVQGRYLHEIQSIIDESDDIDMASNRLNKLEIHALSNLHDDDYFIVMATIASTRSQLLFLHNNIHRIDNIRNSYRPSLEPAKTNCVSSWRAIGVATVAGGASGASACGVARFFGPVGWKAWGACVIGGAVGAAVYEGVYQCLTPTTVQTWNGIPYPSAGPRIIF